MPKTLYFLTEGDRDKVRDLIDGVAHEVTGIKKPSDSLESPASSDVFVAKAPGGGVPARSSVTPGGAKCVIYRVVPGSTLRVVGTGLAQKVHNLSTTAIPADSYFAIKRDKWGYWLADMYAAGGTDHSCHAYHSTSQTVTNGADTVLTMDSEYFDTDAYHSISSNAGRITIPSALASKKHFLWWDVLADFDSASPSGSSYCYLTLLKNGAADGLISRVYNFVSPTGLYAKITMNGGVDINAVASDYWELRLSNRDGTNSIRVTNVNFGIYEHSLAG